MTENWHVVCTLTGYRKGHLQQEKGDFKKSVKKGSVAQNGLSMDSLADISMQDVLAKALGQEAGKVLTLPAHRLTNTHSDISCLNAYMHFNCFLKMNMCMSLICMNNGIWWRGST